MKLPPKDSWMKLSPGAGGAIDATLEDMTRTFRSVRGDILAVAFQIEYALGSILTEVFSWSCSRGRVTRRRSATFNAKTADFNKKIQLLEELCAELPSLGQTVSKDLIERLDRVRKWRNRFAHYPVTFVPVGTFPNQELKPILVCDDGERELTDALLIEIYSLFASTESDLGSVLTRLKSEAPAGPMRT